MLPDLLDIPFSSHLSLCATNERKLTYLTIYEEEVNYLLDPPAEPFTMKVEVRLINKLIGSPCGTFHCHKEYFSSVGNALIIQSTYANCFIIKLLREMLTTLHMKVQKKLLKNALFHCEHERATWFGSNLGLLSHFITLIKIKDQWISFLKLCDKAIPCQLPLCLKLGPWPCGEVEMISSLGE